MRSSTAVTAVSTHGLINIASGRLISAPSCRLGRSALSLGDRLLHSGGMAKSYRLGPARRAVNVLMTPMVRLGIGGKSTYLLTTTGRRTGEKRTTPVVLVEADSERWLVAPYGAVGWVHNVRSQPNVSLRRGKKTETLRAEEVGSEAAAPILRRYLERASVTAPFFDAKKGDPVENFEEEASRHPVFKLIATSRRSLRTRAASGETLGDSFPPTQQSCEQSTN